METPELPEESRLETPPNVPETRFKPPSQQAREAYLAEPKFDQDEGLSEEDKTIADSFQRAIPRHIDVRFRSSLLLSEL